MNRLILLGILWCLTISTGWAQEVFPTPNFPQQPDASTPSTGAGKTAQLRIDYEAANKQAHDLAESLRQTPDAAKKAELRTAVQRAFTLRQSLLRAELQEMQARLEKTQQSLDMRDHIADQIVDRRVEDLLNPQLNWDNNGSTETKESITSAANPSPKLETTAPVTELEGEWHLVSQRDYQGQEQEIAPYNRTYRGGRSKSVWSGGGHDSRIEIFPESKTYHYFTKDDDTSFFVNHYELKNDRLIVRDSPDDKGIEVFERGHVRIPSVAPPATPEQKLLWRSAIVEIAIYPSIESPRSQDELVIGRGIVISSDGMILSELPVSEDGDFSQTNIKAKFDDGSNIPLKLIEEAGQGWAVLQPEQPISVNHYFELSATEVQLHDEVRVWGPDHSQAGSESLAPFANTVSALDRKYPALGIAVWQLRIGLQPVLGTPILDADGDLLGMTITGARDLLLAIPVAELKTMFPKSFGQPSEREPRPVEALPDWLSELQGAWTVTESPLFVDENSGGQMKEIRIDRDHWSIVWMGDPDRVESLRVIRPDEKNVYAIDLVEPSTGKVVYPSLYKLDQSGLMFSYGHLGTRPKEIGNVVTIKLTRDQ